MNRWEEVDRYKQTVKETMADYREEVKKLREEVKDLQKVEEQNKELKERVRDLERTIERVENETEAERDQLRTYVDEEVKSWGVPIWEHVHRVEEKVEVKLEIDQYLKNRLEAVEEQLEIDSGPVNQIKSSEDREDELTVEDVRQRIENSENPVHERRAEDRKELTEKQEDLYSYVLANPGCSKEELEEASHTNWPNTIQSFRTILDKKWQLPVSFCNRFGLETSFDRESMVNDSQNQSIEVEGRRTT